MLNKHKTISTRLYNVCIVLLINKLKQIENLNDKHLFVASKNN